MLLVFDSPANTAFAPWMTEKPCKFLDLIRMQVLHDIKKNAWTFENSNSCHFAHLKDGGRGTREVPFMKHRQHLEDRGWELNHRWTPPGALPTKYDTPRGQVIIVHQEDQARVLPYIEKTSQQNCLPQKS